MPYLLTVSRTDYSQRKANWMRPDYAPETMRFGSRQQPLAYLSVMVLVDDDGNIIKSVPMLSPKGLLRVDDRILVACYSEVRSVSLDLLESRTLIDEKWCNDLHSLRAGPNGVLMAVSGIDSAAEFRSDGTVAWQWWAADHGYDIDQEGQSWAFQKSADHRQFAYPVRRQSTHINAVAMLDDTTFVATLLHTGQLIAIDRDSGATKILLEGLGRPHAVRSLGDGMISFADTLRGDAVVAQIDRDGAKVTQRIGIDSSWVHDAHRIEGGWLFADGANCRVVHTDDAGTVMRVDQFDPDWCLYEVLPVGDDVGHAATES